MNNKTKKKNPTHPLIIEILIKEDVRNGDDTNIIQNKLEKEEEEEEDDEERDTTTMTKLQRKQKINKYVIIIIFCY